jgi:WD40 repeat protein
MVFPLHHTLILVYAIKSADESTRFDTQDALYDLAWSESHENQVVGAAGDGSLKLFDITLNEFPVQAWQEHKREVFAVHWNLVTKDSFCSSSWDGTVKIVMFPPSDSPP